MSFPGLGMIWRKYNRPAIVQKLLVTLQISMSGFNQFLPNPRHRLPLNPDITAKVSYRNTVKQFGLLVDKIKVALFGRFK